ncbi:MAG: flagellar hook protein FlgE [Terriglobales bacterium]
MASFSVPLSGLDASSQQLTLIANNLANVNTTGYKSSSADFSTLFYESLGSSGDGNPIQVGTGTQLGSVSMNLNDGAINTTGIASNAAIQGDGMFVINKAGQQLYTRAGDFTVTGAGILETADGAQVMGYPALNGVVNTNAPVGSLQIGSGVSSPAQATTSLKVGLNLDSQTAVGGTFSDPVQVYDSLGGTHTVTATFTKTAVNTWGYNMTLPGADTGSPTPTTVASGSVSFDTSGNVVPTTPGPPPVSDITVTSAALTDGASPVSLTWHLYDGSGNSLLTQAAAPSTPLSALQDGHASGNLLNFSIANDGSITGSFSNGQSQVLGQLAMATFANDQGIQAMGNNAFAATLASGPATVGTPGTGSRGQLEGGAVEESNVNLAAEFANLIQAQNGYQANAKAVSTFNQVMQVTINMQTGA